VSGAAPGFPVWANGRIVPPATPVIAAEDLGLLLGLSVYDTLLLADGCIYFLEEHVERLRRGAAELRIPWPPPWDPAAALVAIARALDGRAAALRITLTRGVPGRGPTMVVTPRELEVPADPGVAVHVSVHKKLGGNPLEGVKSTNRMRNVLAREEAQAHGAWEALLMNHDGDFSEGTVSNVWFVVGAELLTPGLERGCLQGIVRERLLADLGARPLVVQGRPVPVRVGRVGVEDAARATEVFLTNTTGRVTPVTEVSGLAAPIRALPGSSGPVTRVLRERMDEIERRYRESPLNLLRA
jgi:branched-chain amino acid aminotransferase